MFNCVTLANTETIVNNDLLVGVKELECIGDSLEVVFGCKMELREVS